MESSCRGFLAMLLFLAGLTASGSSNRIIEGPQNATVLKGSEARFNCTVSLDWKLIMWALKGVVVVSLTPQEPIITNNRFTSANYSVDGNFVSEMIIHDAQPSDSGPVQCSLQNSDLFGTAFLSVQVMGTLDIPGGSLMVTEGEPYNVTCYALGWTPLPEISWEVQVPVSHSSDFSFLESGGAVSILALTPLGNGSLTCVANLKSVQASSSLTVNLTVVHPPLDSVDRADSSLPTWAIVLLAVSLSLLLILIIVLIIIFCCCCVSGREKKESSYQNEIRKSANMKTSKAVPETKLKSGRENYGFSSDGARTAQIASLPPKSHKVSILDQHSNSSGLPHQRSHLPEGTSLGVMDAPALDSRSKVYFHIHRQRGQDRMANLRGPHSSSWRCSQSIHTQEANGGRNP
ncbi:immunoglobulin superfamily member 5 isoform X2 [Nannospalax galili]|uniref:immunoglobulin superfamily member 5 isoform X2 n=1 Tax=Nannospalax galili TaxID=1026970 RepID=UPI00111BF2AD|nr:immunoglobulin superfamily member 5 isoform X2 [Nannospalax galili]